MKYDFSVASAYTTWLHRQALDGKSVAGSNDDVQASLSDRNSERGKPPLGETRNRAFHGPVLSFQFEFRHTLEFVAMRFWAVLPVNTVTSTNQ